MGFGEWLWVPRVFRRLSAPATAQVQDSGDSLELVCLTCRSSPQGSRCPRGGGVDRAGVLAASATASEEPCTSALCVQVLSRDPPPNGQTERATRGTPGPRRIQWCGTKQPVGEQLTPNSASPGPTRHNHGYPPAPSTTKRPVSTTPHIDVYYLSVTLSLYI